MQKSIQKYQRHSTVELEDVWKLIENGLSEKKPKAVVNGIPVNVSSLRLKTFYYGITCTCCGLKATHFALERDIKSPEDMPYHLNLWGSDAEGEPVLFTHDHTLARALGGKDRLENTTTMCCHCNWTKGDAEGILAQQLRK